MSDLQQFIATWTGLDLDTQKKLILSLVLILVLVILRAVVRRVLHRRIGDARQRYRWSRVATYTIVTLGAIIVARIWFTGVTSILNWLGLVSAGIAIALHETIANLAGWVFILWRRPFQVGDRVEIDGYSGDVIDIRLFQFSLMETRKWVDADQSTGRILHVPNGKVMRDPLANYTQGFRFIWHELTVLITFESDWEKAREILEGIVKEVVEPLAEGAENEIRSTARKFMIYYGKLTPIVYLTVKDSGVLLTARYLINPRHRRGVEEAMWTAILRAFAAEPDIELAYPTIRYYQPGEGGIPPGSEPRTRTGDASEHA